MSATGERLGVGGTAQVQGFVTASGHRLAGKIIKPDLRSMHLLERELHAYRTVYEQIGPHPNLCNVYGIAEVEVAGKPERVLLMDDVRGMDGTNFIDAMRKCMETGKISHADFVNATKFYLASTLGGIQYLQTGDFIHNDIKPGNVRIAGQQPPMAGTRRASGTARSAATKWPGTVLAPEPLNITGRFMQAMQCRDCSTAGTSYPVERPAPTRARKQLDFTTSARQSWVSDSHFAP
ncbi:protein kinase family protein [Noviherbaspirillum aerium]|uniref:protein kinase family protein n=1 Tax=Noviherbaspirillum aerium TaxID=2588497 RepID=UPI00178C6B52|nr:protein kinase family protein [Noviherbaspirillum aerium]